MTRPALAIAVFLVAAATAARADAPAPSEAARILASPEASVADRVAAAQALDAARSKEERDRALPPLLDALADPSPDVRAAAAGALSRIGDERALPRLVKRLSAEADVSVVAALLLAVGATGGAPEVPLLTPYAGGASPRVRAAAATALGDLGGSAARERLLSLLLAPGDDPEWAVRGAAVLGLARCGTPDDAGPIFVAYRDGEGASSWFARACLARAVAALDRDPVPTLDRLLGDDDARVSSAAAAGFVRARKTDDLVKRLDDRRPGVRAACAAAVADLRVEAAVPKVISMATSDPSRAVRWSAALALSRLDVPASDGLLLEGLASDDAMVWATALGELERKTGSHAGRDAEAWRAILSRRRAAQPR